MEKPIIEPVSQEVIKKKKEKPAPEEPKSAYRLVYADTQLQTRELTEKDFELLQKECPEFAKLILNPELLKEQTINDKLTNERWQTTANTILETIKKNKLSKIFHEPVPWQKMNLIDYPVIVKEPMDFSTIKNKLALNIYGKVQDFVKDMELVFYNCRIYNGVESHVGRIGLEVAKEWESLQRAFNLMGKYENQPNHFNLDKEGDVTKIFTASSSEDKPNENEQGPSEARNDDDIVKDDE